MVHRRKIDPTLSAANLYAVLLRRHRDAKGWSQSALGDHAGYTGDTISKIELAKQAASMDLSTFFDETFDTGETFQQLQPLAARDIATPGFFRPYLDREARATALRVYEPLFIPGLLQDEAYARTVLSAGQRPKEVDELVSARMERKKILTQDDPPWLIVLVDEAALRRRVGGAEVMRKQLERLLEIAQQPNVTLQAIPAGASIYPEGAFTIMDFEGEASVGYVEGVAELGQVIQKSETVDLLVVLFDLVRGRALSVDASMDLIQKIMEEL